MRTNQRSAPRNIVGVADRRKVLERSCVATSDEHLHGEPLEVHGRSLDLGSQPALILTERVTVGQQLGQPSFRRGERHQLRCSFGCDPGQFGPQRITGCNITAQILDRLCRGGKRVHATEHPEHGKQPDEDPKSRRTALGDAKAPVELRPRLNGVTAGSDVVRCN